MSRVGMITVAAQDWLDDDGLLPRHGRIRTLALRMVQCIEAGAALQRGWGRETLIACRRRVGGAPCMGLLWVVKSDRDAIHAFCMVCKHDELMISGWQDTLWAEGPMEPVPMERVRDEPTS